MNYPQDFYNKIINGDCLKIMAEIPADSIDTILFSPPYDGMRDYEKDKWGIDLSAIGLECFRILKTGGIAIMIIQDQTKNFAKTLTTFKTIVDWCQKFKLFECCIYKKSARPGAWWASRFRVDHEYLPIFLKGDRPQFFDKSHMATTATREWNIHGTERHTSGELKKNFRPEKRNDKSQGTIFDYNSSTREFPAYKHLKHKHPATAPYKLCQDLLKCFTPASGIILDPFAGSGTTCKAAQILGLTFIGIDINPDYCKIAEDIINFKEP